MNPITIILIFAILLILSLIYYYNIPKKTPTTTNQSMQIPPKPVTGIDQFTALWFHKASTQNTYQEQYMYIEHPLNSNTLILYYINNPKKMATFNITNYDNINNKLTLSTQENNRSFQSEIAYIKETDKLKLILKNNNAPDDVIEFERVPTKTDQSLLKFNKTWNYVIDSKPDTITINVINDKISKLNSEYRLTSYENNVLTFKRGLNSPEITLSLNNDGTLTGNAEDIKIILS